MFSTLLPGVSANMKFMQNGSSTQSNRSFVRVFKSPANPHFPYPNTNPYDLGYQSLPQAEQLPPNWYATSSFNGPYGHDYARYQNPTNDPYAYERSFGITTNQFPDFDDTSSITTNATFSPAMSTDSIEALKSPMDAESPVEEFDTAGSGHPSGHTTFPYDMSIASQVAPIGRTSSTYLTSGNPVSSNEFSSNRPNLPLRTATPFRAAIGENHFMPHAFHQGIPVPLPDDTRSTISELEVEERDRIAKMNAQYNAASSSAFFTSGTVPSQVSKKSVDGHLAQNTTSRSIQTRGCIRPSSTQPRHPDLYFPPVSFGNEKGSGTATYDRGVNSSMPLYASLDGSPPSVERVPSQLQLENVANHTIRETAANTIVHDAALESGRLSRTGNHRPGPETALLSQNASPKYPSVGHLKNNSGIPYEQPHVKEGQDTLYPSTFSAEVGRQRKTSLLIASGPDTNLNRVNEAQNYLRINTTANAIQEDIPSKDVSPSYKNTQSPHRHLLNPNTSPRKQAVLGSDSDSTSRSALGADLRRDTKTPGISSRRLSYIQTDPSSLKTISSEGRNSLETREKSSPKISLHDTYNNFDNGRSAITSSPSSSSPVPMTREQSSLVSQSTTSYSSEHHPRPRSIITVERPTILESIENASPSVAAPTSGYNEGHPASHGTRERAPSMVSKKTDFWSTRDTPRIGGLHESSKVCDGSSVPYTQYAHKSTVDHKSASPSSPHPYPETTQREGDEALKPLSSALQDRLTTFITLPSKAASDPPQSAPAAGFPEPHRRYSDGDQVTPPIRPPLSGRNSAPLVRSVRWTKNLIAPSPVLSPPRRKGWFNRRGDQLWTNDGAYKPPRSGDEYPPDLDDYPEPGEGWMNDDSVRIDMNHRRIPKSLPRSALKKT